jgi:hypothetical protein
MPEPTDTNQNSAVLPLKLFWNYLQQRLPLVTWQQILLMQTGNMTADMKEVSIEKILKQNTSRELPVTSQSQMLRVLMNSVVMSWNGIFSSNVSCWLRLQHSPNQPYIPKLWIRRQHVSGQRQKGTEHWVIIANQGTASDGKTKKLMIRRSFENRHEHCESLRFRTIEHHN